MHEIALSAQLADVVRRNARGHSVTDVRVRIGALRQVVPATLQYAWTFTVKGTDLEAATLSIEWVDAVIRCQRGHTRVVAADAYLDLKCWECDADTHVIQGEEFTVIDIEIQE